MIQTSIEQDVKMQVFESFKNLKESFACSTPLSLKYRIEKLNALEQNLLKFKERIEKALHDDFRKPGFETDTSEILTSLVELRKAKRELHKWIRPQPVATPAELTGTNHYIRYEPKGVVLIISPWNYPVSLALIPMIAAWAAGNRIVMKPSEFTKQTSSIIAALIRETFSEEEIVVVNGGADVANALTQLPFNQIFFTGSKATAKKILKVAAENLTPVTLELGGKSPLIINEDVNLKSVVKDIAYAKCINAGQTCIAPDFILLPEKMQKEFVEQWNNAIISLYGDTMIANADYCGIIHEKHYLNLMNMIQESLDQGAELCEPISRDVEMLKIKPVLLLNSEWNHASMQEEIFGPVLPIITYKNIQEVLTPLQNMNRPLTLYLFSKNQSWIDNILNVVRSGGVTINNCLLNYCNFNLPFGGDHHSGHGVNHGRNGFETFSHKRSVSVQGKLLNPLRFFYPPFDNTKVKIKNIALKILGKI